MIQDALQLLEANGCPVCNFIEQSEDRFFFWFLEEYQTPEHLQAFCAALGMCPPHTRRLLSSADPSVLNFLYVHTMGVAADRLGSGPDAACPACVHLNWARQHATEIIIKALRFSPVADAYADSYGMCLPHFRGAVVDAPVGAFKKMAEVLEMRLGDLQAFTGFDADAQTRAFLFRQLVATNAQSFLQGRGGIPQHLVRAIRKPICPSCLAGGRAELQYLQWIADRKRPFAATPSEVELCPSHLADLAHLHSKAAEWVACIERERWREALGKIRKLLAAYRGDGFARWRKRRLNKHIRFLLRARECGACYAMRTNEEREIELLVAALEDGSFARRYESSHGICLRHLKGQDERLVRTAKARLAVLTWELEESNRKRNWSVRYELPGEEANAWLRAAGQIDGRVFLGGPAVLFSASQP